MLEKVEYSIPDAFNTLNIEKENNQNRISILNDKILDLKQDFERQRETKPMFWHFWFNTKSAKTYKTTVNSINGKIDTARNEIENFKKQIEEIEDKILKLTKYNYIKEEFDQFTPDGAFWKEAFKDEKPSKSQELSPWFNETLKNHSISLFFQALKLHSVFLSLASKQIKSNIELLVCHFGRKINNISDEDIKGIWNTLFLLVPVISTTFASVSNLFKNINEETFGWLFIDEAGQAIPQAAVGAINRCKRVVAVGDPLQIEPVVTLPEKVFDYIKKENDIPMDIFSTKSSVQSFFDKINPLGTFVNADMWIGSPLNIHRRCAEPMFSISNEIAYNGIMQNANRGREIPTIGSLNSRYDNIQGTCTIKQFVPEQGIHAIKLIQDYYDGLENKEKFSLFVISPFKTVVYEFKKQVRYNLPKDIQQKMIGKIGTVHTFQGKEADIVLFISGCDGTKTGAINWADSTPNLLNVALTRAKKVFIAIGNKSLYKNTRYFSKMISKLDNNK